MSGGYQTDEGGADIVVTESFPANGFHSWTFHAENHSNVKTETIRLFLLCAS